MAKQTSTLRKRDTHSFRVDDDVWEAAKERAAAADMTVSKVVARLVEGYAAKKISVQEEVTYQ